ncbi:MAG: PA2169 family four-helix-bundle protein [Chitinophagaceae bacterium]|jgi:uncharacterized protein (TIGR02284 family)
MNTQKSISILNSLVEINNDRIQGYEKAITETTDNDLKELFEEFGQSSKKCWKELVEEIGNMDGEPVDDTTISGKFYRLWMDVKAAITNRDRKAILNSCEYGEDAALETYNSVLTNQIDFLTIEQHKMIYKQYVLLKADHNKLQELRDALVEDFN